MVPEYEALESWYGYTAAVITIVRRTQKQLSGVGLRPGHVVPLPVKGLTGQIGCVEDLVIHLATFLVVG